MQLVKQTPKRISPFYHDNFSRIFDDFFGPVHYSVSTPARQVAMAVDIYEKDEKIFIEAELSGVKKEDINIDVKGKLLTLKAEKNEEKEADGENSFRKERYYGSLERTFTLPYEVNENHVTASYKNGLLTLEISQPEEQKATQITIN